MIADFAEVESRNTRYVAISKPLFLISQTPSKTSEYHFARDISTFHFCSLLCTATTCSSGYDSMPCLVFRVNGWINSFHSLS